MPTRSSNAIDIVIPHFNDLQHLTRCLEALMPQLDQDDGVIVADNGSDADLSLVTTRWPELRLVHQPVRGAGPARNAGAAEATAPWLAFLDSDCLPNNNWVSVARGAAQEHAVIGGLVTVFDDTEPPRSGAEAFEAVFAFRIESYIEKGFLPSCQLIMSRVAFDRVGAFHAAVSEDVDWSRRAAGAGLLLKLAPNLGISHPSRSDWPALRHKWRRLTSEGFLLDGQGVGGRLKWAAKALLMPFSVLLHAQRILSHSALSGVEKRRGLATLCRLRVARMIWMLKQAITGRA